MRLPLTLLLLFTTAVHSSASSLTPDEWQVACGATTAAYVGRALGVSTGTVGGGSC